MKSHKTFGRKDRGFTLIEIITVLALFSLLLGIGAFSSFDAYRLYKFNVEQRNLVSLLNRTRSLSMSNYQESAHGIRIEEGSNDFILLPGEEKIPRDSDIIILITPTSTPPVEIIFEQLSGRTDEITINLTENNRSRKIEINDEGTISWE